ncbi:MAG TPA: D-sedoheptulose 7-phosphate isomerase [Vicinamibacteria bacterium]|jgi:D-sedoheptulose 7-phosphate isomerase|nr:D-sedoheptulose 7-phosphate isomerase [Vicinamibacteria bacterium]
MDEQAVRLVAAESVALKQRFFEANAGLLVAAGRRMAESLRGGGRVLAFGNGGSAADAQHLAGELVGRFRRDRAALSAIALTTDSSVVTAIGNDMGYDSVFRRQVEAHGRPGDVAVGITTSGRSPNVVQALQLARERGLVTMGLTGGGGGRLAGAVDYLIDVPHAETARIQEVHVMVVHVLCQIVEEEMPRG